MCFSKQRLYVISTMSTESTGFFFFFKWETEIKLNPPPNNKSATKINLLTLKANADSYRIVRWPRPLRADPRRHLQGEDE